MSIEAETKRQENLAIVLRIISISRYPEPSVTVLVGRMVDGEFIPQFREIVLHALDTMNIMFAGPEDVAQKHADFIKFMEALK